MAQLPSSHRIGGNSARQLVLTIRHSASLENLSKAGEGKEMVLGAQWALMTSVRRRQWLEHTRYQLCHLNRTRGSLTPLPSMDIVGRLTPSKDLIECERAPYPAILKTAMAFDLPSSAKDTTCLDLGPGSRRWGVAVMSPWHTYPRLDSVLR